MTRLGSKSTGKRCPGGEGRKLLGAAVLAAAAGHARAQEPVLFSLSSSGQAAFGSLEDEEIGRRDPATGLVLPWMRAGTGAFFAGDATGDGVIDTWNDVDALSVPGTGSGSVGDVYVSLLSDLGPFLDGDVLRLTGQGTAEVAFAEADVVTAFGLVDGNCDVDAFHYDPAGTHWLSFAEVEDSTILSSDNPGQIFDAAIVWWTPATGQVGVLYSEAQVDQMISIALNSSQTAGDVLGVAAAADGTVHFTVQSPSSADGAVFSDATGGTLVQDELALGFSNDVEINALSYDPTGSRFPVAQAEPTVVSSGSPWSVTVSGDPLAPYWILFSLARGDAAVIAGNGCRGLFLSPTDALLFWSLGAGWLRGTMDAAGLAAVPMPALQSFTGDLLGQVYDPAAQSFGTPFAVGLGQ